MLTNTQLQNIIELLSSAHDKLVNKVARLTAENRELAAQNEHLKHQLEEKETTHENR